MCARRARRPAAERGSVQWPLSRQRHRGHTFASQAVMSGETLPLVGQLLGHWLHRTTAGCAHLADEQLLEAAEKVGSLIVQAMMA